MDRLDALQLNRATLDRQLLLGRTARPARDAIEHLAGRRPRPPWRPTPGCGRGWPASATKIWKIF